eukprot:gene14779-21841_t
MTGITFIRNTLGDLFCGNLGAARKAAGKATIKATKTEECALKGDYRRHGLRTTNNALGCDCPSFLWETQ